MTFATPVCYEVETVIKARFKMQSLNYNRLGLMSRKSASDIQKVHLVSQGISIFESSGGILNCLLVNLVLEASNADVKSDSFDTRIQLFGFSQQEFASLAGRATEFLAKANLVCGFWVEA